MTASSGKSYGFRGDTRGAPATAPRDVVARVARADAMAKLLRDCGPRLDPNSVALWTRFESYDPKQADVLAAIGGYLDDLPNRIAAGSSIFFIGPPGTGKDHLAIAIAREAVMTIPGFVARWLDASVFRSELRDAMDSAKKEREVLSPYIKAGILILSDPVAIGSTLTDYQADSLFRLIDGRYRAMRPTFVTSNVRTEDEAVTLLGSQIVDRLTHGGLRLRCSWESYRTRKAKKR